ncbi:hypothetical protein [Primorskyibacter sp. 2E233]|uniref:hypothetical protein n=1 Tax=Primorskyibacter sp. 2E233 TaxID=3413431 RepID=UPI003BF352E8
MTTPDSKAQGSSKRTLVEVQHRLRRARREQINRLLSDIQRNLPERENQSEAK